MHVPTLRGSLLILLVAGRLVAGEADPVVAAILAEGKERSQVMDHLRHLCKAIGPRLTGSSNLEKAQLWAEERFKSWGLEARREDWGTVAVGYDRGPWSAKLIAPQRKDLRIGFHSWTPGTEGPVRGPAVLAPTNAEELAKVKDKLAGAWVILPVKPLGNAWIAELRKAFDEVKVAGVIRGVAGDLIVTGGQMPATWESQARRVNVMMVGKDHAEILDLIKAGTPVELEIDIKATFRRGPIPQCNVIAEIKGSTKPDEVVVVGGHLDSWDGAEGCTDNGTGAATTLEAARLLAHAKARPQRTIRFMLWSGEEQGLLGSQGWIRKHRDELPKISCAMVHDMGTNAVCGILCTKTMQPILEGVFAPVIGLDPAFPFAVRVSASQGLPAGAGSDHDSYLAAGVPGFFWAQKGKQVYSHEHHTQYDTFEAAIPEDQKHSARVIAIGAWGIANLDALLPREGISARGAAPPRRTLGVQIGEGTTVASVMDDSPASRAGFQAGDEIIKVGAATVTDATSLNAARDAATKTVTITVMRAGKEVPLNVTFDR